MNLVKPLTVLFGLLFLFSCELENTPVFLYQTDPEVITLVQSKIAHYPDMTFLVLADPHYYAPELGTTGSAFEAYLSQDRKMLKESSEILTAAVKEIESVPADFVLVCGDLTKDGELISHQQVAVLLAEIEEQGKPVYVVPGNHDINNGEAMRFDGDEAVKVATVSADTYKTIYHDFGYGEAIARDPNSLSYIVEPVPGLWLFGLDSCRYDENPADGHPETGGRFSAETLAWIEKRLIAAVQNQKAVMGFLHHGVLEHYSANEKHFPEYLLEDFEPVSKMFAAYGMHFVFTGHYHAQDVTRKSWASAISDHFLFDVETGSLVTYPVPWRQAVVRDQSMTISSESIQSIDSHPSDFLTFAEQFVLEGMVDTINARLIAYGVPEADQELLTPQIAEAYVTHLAGDEQVPDQYLDFSGVSLMGRLVGLVQGDLIRGWYTDLAPADNNLVIDTVRGEVENPWSSD